MDYRHTSLDSEPPDCDHTRMWRQGDDLAKYLFWWSLAGGALLGLLVTAAFAVLQRKQEIKRTLSALWKRGHQAESTIAFLNPKNKSSIRAAKRDHERFLYTYWDNDEVFDAILTKDEHRVLVRGINDLRELLNLRSQKQFRVFAGWVNVGVEQPDGSMKKVMQPYGTWLKANGTEKQLKEFVEYWTKENRLRDNVERILRRKMTGFDEPKLPDVVNAKITFWFVAWTMFKAWFKETTKRTWDSVVAEYKDDVTNYRDGHEGGETNGRES